MNRLIRLVLVASVALVSCKNEPAPAPLAPPAVPPPAPAAPVAEPPADETTKAYARYESLAAEQTPSFDALAALVTTLDALPAPASPAALAKLELVRTQALAKTLDVLAPVGDPLPAQEAFLKQCGDKVENNELAGRHYLSHARLWKLAEVHAATPGGDELAWIAASTPTQGECEGYLPCVLGRALGTDGEYLRRFPAGAHAGEALLQLRQALPALDDESLAALTALDDADRTAARASLKTLQVHVAATSHAEKPATQGALKALDDALTKASPAK